MLDLDEKRTVTLFENFPFPFYLTLDLDEKRTVTKDILDFKMILG